MKVLLVHSRYQQLGGEESVLESEGNLLSAKGIEVRLLQASNDSIVGIKGKLEASKAVFYSAPEVKRLNAFTAAFQPDIVHVHNWFPSLSPAIFRACHDRGFPVVHTLHNYRLLCIKGSLYRDGSPCEQCLGTSLRLAGLLHSCYRESRMGSAIATAGMLTHWRLGTWHHAVDRFIVLSEFARAKFIEGGLPADKLAVKPNCLDRDPGAQPGDGGYFAYVGRLTEEKGLLAVLRCWQAGPDLPTLKIAGSGPLEEQARMAASSLSNVEWLGMQTSSGVADILAGAKALICPSLYYEGMPRIVIEAMAAGTPVIASRLGTYLEMIDHGNSGMLFAPNNEQLLLASIREFLCEQDPLRMRTAARKQFEDRYSSEANLDRLLEIYQQARDTARPSTTEPGEELA
jgi:glycosyltransferase involved in cell wall biosynthesis